MKKHVKMMLVLGLVLGMVGMVSSSIAGQGKSLMMATTTSTDNTGLLDYLAPEFSKTTGIELKWTAVGTGKALKLGQNCDVDLVMVHAPGAEKKYLDAGFGIDRREVMFNDFVIIGPSADPAGIKGTDVKGALEAIATKYATMVNSVLDTAVPILKKVPLLGDQVLNVVTEIEEFAENILNICTKADRVIQDVEAGLTTADVGKLQGHVGELGNMTKAMRKIIPASAK